MGFAKKQLLFNETSEKESRNKAEEIPDTLNTKDYIFKSIYATIISNMQKYFGTDSGWIIDLVIDHKINVLRYNGLSVSSYQISKGIGPPKRRLANIRNTDGNKCFTWCLVRYLLTKLKHKFSSALMFLVIKKKIDSMCKKSYGNKHVDLLSIGEIEKSTMFLLRILTHSWMITNFRVEEDVLGTVGAMKCHIKDCFQFNGKQRIKMLAKCEYVRFKNYEKKIIYDLCRFCVLVSEDMGSKIQIRTNIKNMFLVNI